MPPRKAASPDTSASPPRGRKSAAEPVSCAKAEAKASSPLGLEADLWKSANELCGNMEPSDYNHVALGLIFLKYISDAFEALHQQPIDDDPDMAEERDAYLAENVFWVPSDARWSFLQQHSKSVEIGAHIDRAMQLIEKENPSLKGVLSKDYARPSLTKVMLGELVDTFSNLKLHGDSSKEVLGRVHAYFLSHFAGAEGKRGGEFYTPSSVPSIDEILPGSIALRLVRHTESRSVDVATNP